MNLRIFFIYFITLLGIISCSNDNNIINDTPLPYEFENGVYILNEGIKDKNNASLDFFSFKTNEYSSNIFSKINPTVANGLGDVGNDLQLYNGKLYAVINLSNYIEVMDAKTVRHIGTINIPACRSIAFHNGYAYVTSYAGELDEHNKIQGEVYKINTSTLQIINKISVGYYPEGLAVVNNKLYVVNSGGLYFPNYDNRLSVIDLDAFTVTKNVQVPLNPAQVKVDKNNNVWVTSRGNYNDVPPSITIISSSDEKIVKTLNITVDNFDFYGSNLYYYGTTWEGFNPTNNYGIIDINTQSITNTHLINPDIESQIGSPYGLIVNPENGDIILADAKNYSTLGKIYFLDNYGNTKWETKTANYIPGHFAIIE